MGRVTWDMEESSSFTDGDQGRQVRGEHFRAELWVMGRSSPGDEEGKDP